MVPRSTQDARKTELRHEASVSLGYDVRSSIRPRLSPASSARPPWTLAAAFFLSGASALVYELLWFRLLSHVLGSTATATATLLAAYLFGLGLGAWVFGRLVDRGAASAPLLYVAAECGIGLYG